MAASAAAKLAAEMTGSLRTRVVTLGTFPYDVPFKRLDVRREPHLYRPGRGEQGVLMVEPYKSEILPHWQFKTPKDATRSSEHLEKMFHGYLDDHDFIGADMTRKFIQMGYTRSRRYAAHAGGRIYVVPAKDLVVEAHERPKDKREKIEQTGDEDQEKAESARIFHEVLERVKAEKRYTELRDAFAAKYKDVPIPIFDEEKAKPRSKKTSEARLGKGKR